MFKLCAKLFGFVLNFIYGIVNNYGVAIIIFTVVLKLLMLPMSIKQQKTMKKNAKIQVKVKELQEKYASDPTRMNQEVMDLYKRENMSPFSGCLGTIFQFIIVLSMFYLVSSPLTYMLNMDQETINGYVQTIQEESEDSNKALRYREIAVINRFGDSDEKIDLNMNFLGLNLSSVPSQDFKENPTVLIIPILYVITSFVSMKITTVLNSKNTKNAQKSENKKKDIKTNLPEKVDDKEDTAEMMEQMNKSMSLMMPIMTVSIAIIAPLGLALYWLLSNVFAIFERVIVFKLVKTEEEE